MAAQSQYEQLARQLSAIGAVKRGLARVLPNDCPPGSIAVLNLLDLHGEMRMSRMPSCWPSTCRSPAVMWHTWRTVAGSTGPRTRRTAGPGSSVSRPRASSC
ncbi:MarR-family transcriptional regulator [Streptomyces albidoflavus]|nr:MarR-family transcriptional regulator [Streptomyces albidoflavus]